MSEEVEKPEAQENEDVQVGKPDATEETAAPAEEAAVPEAGEKTTESAETPLPTEEAIDPKEVEEGKVFAVLSYALSFVGIPFFIVPLIMRNNEFSLYHAKQCLMIWLLGIAGGIVSSILAAICIGLILGAVVGVFCFVITIMGLISAINNKADPVPLIGKLGIEWFKGLTKA